MSRDESGSASIEAVIGVPAFVLFIGLIVFAGRNATAHQAVESAAADGARSASIARTSAEATVEVTVSCRLDLSDLVVPGVPSSHLVTESVVSPIDLFRGAIMKPNCERGSVSIWLLTSSLAMVMVLGLAVDLGGLVHAQQRAHDLAAQAARTGGQQIEAAPAIEGRYVRIDPAAARAAAAQYLQTADVDGTVTITGGDTVTVSVTDTYSPVFLGFLGDRTVSGEASARVVRSIGGNEE